VLSLLPAVFQEDVVTGQLVGALDEVMAPALSAVDCLGAYLDPLLAPEDFLGLLSAWLGLEVDDRWPLARRRSATAGAIALHRGRGTAAGLREHLELLLPGGVEVVDSGGTSWSATPTDDPADDSADEIAPVTVRVRTGGAPDTEDILAAVEDVVARVKPAHVPHVVTAVRTGDP
jgi:phage tail-like protein